MIRTKKKNTRKVGGKRLEGFILNQFVVEMVSRIKKIVTQENRSKD
jgi:hypothetical protein